MVEIGDEFGVPIYIIERNNREQLRIGLNEYLGTNYIDIRIFYLKDGKYLPSRKGITISKDQYFDLLRGIISLGETLGYDDEILQKCLEE